MRLSAAGACCGDSDIGALALALAAFGEFRAPLLDGAGIAVAAAAAAGAAAPSVWSPRTDRVLILRGSPAPMVPLLGALGGALSLVATGGIVAMSPGAMLACACGLPPA